MKIAYCGYDFFSPVAFELISMKHEIIEVFTFPTDNKYDYSSDMEKVSQICHAPIRNTPLNKDDLVRLSALGCDLVLTAAYPYKIPEDWINYVQFGINIHPSPLPVGRGIWPLPWIILKGLASSAATFHKLSNKWDAGDIIIQESFDVSERENLETLSAKSQLAAKKGIQKLMPNIQELWDKAKPQGQGQYWSSPSKLERTIDWRAGGADIERTSRAFGKFESHCFIDGKKYYVRDLHCWKDEHDFEPGHLVRGSGREYIVAVADGFCCLRFFEPIRLHKGVEHET